MKRKNMIRKIRNWLIVRRNKAVFLNHLILKIHNCLSNKTLPLPPPLAEVYMLVLSKWQCMLTYKAYSRLADGKINTASFNEK